MRSKMCPIFAYSSFARQFSRERSGLWQFLRLTPPPQSNRPAFFASRCHRSIASDPPGEPSSEESKRLAHAFSCCIDLGTPTRCRLSRAYVRESVAC